VAWSDLPENPYSADHWNDLYRWFAEGGCNHVAAYLATLDLSGFNPKAPPKKTDAFWQMVNSGRAPEDAELADVIDYLGNPEALTIDDVKSAAQMMQYHDFAEWIGDRKNRSKLPHRFEAAGYIVVSNQDAKNGLWVIGGKRKRVYGLAALCRRDQIRSAGKL